MLDDTSFYRLSNSDRGIVTFHFWQSLRYEKRLALSFGLILIGLVIQLVTQTFFTGAPFILVGNLFLLVKGYDNRVDTGKWDPSAEWQVIEPGKLEELSKLDKNIRRWDISFLDISNNVGRITFSVIVIGLIIAASITSGLARIILFDGMLLLLPHWITGIRRILRLPGFLVKIESLQIALNAVKAYTPECKVDIMILLKGKKQTLPDDVKFRISFNGQNKNFLGLYGQVVINEVQGTSYPYFYVVIAARNGYGLTKAFDSFKPPVGLIKEFKSDNEVEVIVIRQHTTKTSGYHTIKSTINSIIISGYGYAKGLATSSKS